MTAEHLIERWAAEDRINALDLMRARQQFRVAVTPYYASLIETMTLSDPIWRQVAPAIEREQRPDAYDGARENWEDPVEMPSSILHHKYPDRALVRVRNDCHSFCTFCLQALRVLDAARPKESMGDQLWNATLEAIRQRPAIREVILSGGEPLLFENERLRQILASIRAIPHVDGLRIHTRALTFNPFRVDEGLVDVLRGADVREVAFHVAHPREMTSAFEQAVKRLLSSGALLNAHIPLLRGVNDDPSCLEQLFRDLHQLRIRPYYLIHCMPFIPAVGRFRTSVTAGVRMIRSLKRRVSNPAMPEYIIVHDTGKQTVPAAADGASDFRYERREDGWPVVRFVNWKGDWVEYLDSPDPQ